MVYKLFNQAMMSTLDDTDTRDRLSGRLHELKHILIKTVQHALHSCQEKGCSPE